MNEIMSEIGFPNVDRTQQDDFVGEVGGSRHYERNVMSDGGVCRESATMNNAVFKNRPERFYGNMI
jgi:hypothetical protein